MMSFNDDLLYVSIHAPTWGATDCGQSKDGRKCFNPRAHVGRNNLDKH